MLKSAFLAAIVASLAVPAFADVVEFHIKAGTGPGAWNSAQEPARVKIGDTLRIVNDDSVPHYLHTPGAPCDHGSGPFGPGETYDCAVKAPASPDGTILYDHHFGPTSRFYVEAK